MRALRGQAAEVTLAPLDKFDLGKETGDALSDAPRQWRY